MKRKKNGSNANRREEPFVYKKVDEILKLFEEVVEESPKSGIAIHNLYRAKEIAGLIKNHIEY